jgi:hypothetical protein
MKTVKFYTMLYIDNENKSLSLNGITGTFDQQMKTFIRCCETLNKSLIFFSNLELLVLTNNKSYIENISKDLKCIEIAFDLKIPSDINFYSAHHKIDAFKYLSQNNEQNYFFLIDSDIICINKMPLNLINCIENNIPVYYDITEQWYPAFGRETIVKDKEVLMSKNFSTGIWAGGEFIGGDNNFFKLLFNEIEIVWENYLLNYRNIHHQGDEALISTALENIMQTQYICNAGLYGGIGRYWSVKTLHIQNHWKSYVNNFLVHLPADKNFLAIQSTLNKDIIKKYENYLIKKRISPIWLLKRIIKKIKNKNR